MFAPFTHLDRGSFSPIVTGIATQLLLKGGYFKTKIYCTIAQEKLQMNEKDSLPR